MHYCRRRETRDFLDSAAWAWIPRLAVWTNSWITWPATGAAAARAPSSRVIAAGATGAAALFTEIESEASEAWPDQPMTSLRGVPASIQREIASWPQ